MNIPCRKSLQLVWPLLIVISGCGSCGNGADTALPDDTTEPWEMPLFADLRHADARVGGELDGGELGTVVAPAGSVLGDGRMALLLTEHGLSDSFPAMAHVVPGDLRGEVSIDAAVATISTEHWSDEFKAASARMGDANGDGVDDLLLGVPNRYHKDQGNYEGVATILSGPLTGAHSVAEASVVLASETADGKAGSTVNFVGDLNGDAFDDITISDPSFSGDFGQAGAVYVLYGPLTASGDLSLADYRLEGESNGAGATGGVGIGDANGDGYSDFMVKTDGERLHIFHGPVTESATLTSAVAQIDMDTRAVESAAGDVDGDGADDILVGTPDLCYHCDDYDDRRPFSGAAYVYSGRLEGSHTRQDATVSIVDRVDYSYFGNTAVAVGDVNGDGLADIMVGEAADCGYYDYLPCQGYASLFLGPLMGSLIRYTDGDIHFLGEAKGDWAGVAVAGLGDLDGDGLSDLAIGAPLADIRAEDSGAAYIVLGREDIVGYYQALQDAEDQ